MQNLEMWIYGSKNDIYIETETNSGDEDVKNNNRMAEIVLKITTTSGNIKIDWFEVEVYDEKNFNSRIRT